MVKHYQWVFEKKSPVTSLPPGHCTPWNILKLWVNKTMGKRLHPPKQTWNLKMNPWKWRFLLKTIISRFHVNFQGCRFPNSVRPGKFEKSEFIIFTPWRSCCKSRLRTHFSNYYFELQGVGRSYLGDIWCWASSLHHSLCSMSKNRHIWPASHFSPSLPVCLKKISHFFATEKHRFVREPGPAWVPNGHATCA